MARDGLRTTYPSSAEPPFGALRRVFDLDPAGKQLCPDRVGGLEILGLTGLVSSRNPLGDPAGERGIHRTTRREHVEDTHDAVEHVEGGLGAARILIQLAVRRAHG